MSFNIYQNGIKSDALLKDAVSNMVLFRDQNGCPHAVVNVGLQRNIIDINGERISRWLRRLFLTTRSCTCTPSDIEKVTAYIIALAEDEDIPEHPYFTRIGQIDRTLYYDLGGKDRNMVMITKEQVSVVNNSSLQIFFKKLSPHSTPNLQAQPDQLCELLNPFFRIKHKDDFLLLVVYIISCFIYDINHPILILHGREGSSKSSSVENICKIVDPHGTANRLTMNPDRRSMVAALSNRYFLGFDNLDTILKKWQSDLLCNASTGGSEPMRVLYETNSLQEVNIKGCVCLNGLTVVATEKDLLDRAILIELERIPDNEFLLEAEIKQKFADALPDILGAIFNTLQKSLNLYETVEYYPHCRMQDFAKWGYCIAQALGGFGDVFTQRYALNREKAAQEAKPPLILECMTAFMKFQNSWYGNMTELRDALWSIAKQKGYKGIYFPASASALSRQIGYNKNLLEKEGISYSQHSSGDRKLEIVNHSYVDNLTLD